MIYGTTEASRVQRSWRTAAQVDASGSGRSEQDTGAQDPVPRATGAAAVAFPIPDDAPVTSAVPHCCTMPSPGGRIGRWSCGRLLVRVR